MSTFYKKLRIFARIIRNELKIMHMSQCVEGKLDFTTAELIRNTHSIEKGLSIKNPRLGFGHMKQQEMMDQIEILFRDKSPYRKEVCYMALGALSEYLLYHKANKYTDDFLPKIENFLKKYPMNNTDSYGGIVHINKDEFSFDVAGIERFFRTRHSMRDFDDRPVDDEDLKKALSLAQTAPSACNRQGVRSYVLSREKSKCISKSLVGIGGFEETVDRFVVITGKTSVYRVEEINQYIVSASIYAAYLSLTLHLYGLASCIIQRQVIWSKDWEHIQKQFCIPKDEQCICMIAVGHYKKEAMAPQSHRLSTNEIVCFVK